MILLAFSGSLLVGSDFRLKALPFYLSRRIDRRHYIAGKLLAVSAVVALMTIVPALALFIEYGAFTSSFAYWFENWRLVVSILGYGFVLCAVLSILLVALSAWLQRTAPIAITWSSIFTMLTFVAERMREFTRNNYWTLLDVWRDMRYVGRSFFGYYPREEDRELAWWALAILLGLCTAALIALVHRVRAVDVVE
jgi:ABC-type multidrug transport system permease subunit